MWVDADDVVKGADKLAEYLPKLPPEVAGVWLPYHYSQAGEGGPTSTLFDRERIVRANMPWKWQYRVHEILVPREGMTEHLNWARTDDIAIVHQGQGHDTQGAARRNILLLEMDLEENPEDTRALFYLGNQYFALNEWDAAAQYYERSTTSNNAYQVWQTWLYLSMAYERMGDFGQSLSAAYHAVETAPYHPEPYYRLAALAMLRGDVQRCEFWTKFADTLPDPPAFAFKNPLDRPFNARITLAGAYGNAGFISRAREQLEQATRVIQEPNVVKGIEQYRQMEQENLDAEAWLRTMQIAPIMPQPPENIWKFGRVRDAIVPAMLSRRVSTQPRIIFWCGKSIEPWAPPSLNTTGIGGSETAVIQIAKRFARDGWRVDVYNEPDKYEGEYEGVGYWGLNRLGQDETTTVFVGWRNPATIELPLHRQVSLLWCHDLNQGPQVREAMPKWDRILGVSAWHATYLSQVYEVANTGFVPNGIELDRFSQRVKKIPFRCVYASSQDRGLLDLLRMWPAIVAVEPSAELHVAYGWENFDKWIAMGNQHLAGLKAAILPLLDQKGVVWRGRLPQDELAKLYQESYAWLYPTTFLEVSCISAMEAMAGGAVPVTSAAGALPETLGDGGMIVTGNPYTSAWKMFWLQCAKAALLAPDVRLPLMDKGKERAKTFTWDAAYEKWKQVIDEAMTAKMCNETLALPSREVATCG
jgi:glycosyltransferase involved in cell wall biosynthesis